MTLSENEIKQQNKMKVLQKRIVVFEKWGNNYQIRKRKKINANEM